MCSRFPKLRLVSAVLSISRMVVRPLHLAPTLSGIQYVVQRVELMKMKITAWVDEGLDEHRFIVPGLGDFGDRYEYTLKHVWVELMIDRYFL